jgi:hypothetical protein
LMLLIPTIEPLLDNGKYNTNAPASLNILQQLNNFLKFCTIKILFFLIDFFLHLKFE